MANIITGAEALIQSLLNQGVDTAFVYPGGNIIRVFDSLFSHQSDLKQILVRHEQGATHAAQGYARISGKPGVAIVTSGPGATNTLTGISDAMLDSTPIVVIAGQVGTDALGTDAFQEIDLVGVTQPITKWSYQIRRAQDISWAVARAFYIAQSGRPGPVVLDFTKTAQNETVDYRPEKIDFVRSYIPSPEPDMSEIEAAARLIDCCTRPLVLVGHGVELGNAENELKAFIEKADAPAARTLLGLSALPSDHPLNMGMLGMHGNLAPNVMTNRCDLLIAVGMRFDDRVTSAVDSYARQAKIIHLDIDKSEFGKNVKPDVTVLGDCRRTLALITERISRTCHKEWIEEFKPLAQKEHEKVIDHAINPGEGPLLMGEVVNAIAIQAPSDAALVTDVGLNQMFAARYFKYSVPRSIITSGGLGTMGFSLPAAIGATFGDQERMVFSFQGDGGFQMNMQELGTIMETGAPVKIIVMNNSYLGNVRQWQQMMFESRYSCTHMTSPDISMIAGAYGIPFRRVMDRRELAQAISDMIAASGAFILETIVLDEENVMPMIPGHEPVDHMIFTIDEKWR